jgi:hypothetical protein
VILGSLLMLALVLGLLGGGWVIIFSVVVVCGAGALREQATRPTGHRPAILDYEKRYLYLGLLVLLAGTFIAFVPIMSSDAVQERLAILNTPKPSDCDWVGAPLGNKHCHYESSVSHLKDERGEHTIVKWYRVDD